MKLKPIKRKGRAPKSPFRSKLEESVSNCLKELKKPFQYEGEKISYIIPESLRNYTPDFILTKVDGTSMYIEVKGYLRPSDRVKLRLVKRHRPWLDLRLLFACNNLVSGTKLRYSDWAKKNEFPFAVGEFPTRWIKELKG